MASKHQLIYCLRAAFTRSLAGLHGRSIPNAVANVEGMSRWRLARSPVLPTRCELACPTLAEVCALLPTEASSTAKVTEAGKRQFLSWNEAPREQMYTPSLRRRIPVLNRQGNCWCTSMA